MNTINKKIGIINFHYSNHNYGAVLQAAALQNLVESFGHKAEHIDYIPIPSKLSVFKRFKEIFTEAVKAVDTTGVIVNTPKVYNKEVFEQFRIKNLLRTRDIYQIPSDLNAIENRYSHVIVGSDQVWRPSYTVENRDVYFLSFCGDETRRVSYAASFGVDHWEYGNETLETKTVKAELDKFSAVSVRELSGVKICNNIFSSNATHVLDPTLARGRDYFDKIADDAGVDNVVNEKIVYYKLDPDSEFVSFIDFLEEKLQKKSENIYRKRVGRKYYYNSVNDWLDTIRKAKLVVTDSFHCVCFAILFEREFVYVPNDSRGITRLESLLSTLGLENRIARNNLIKHFSDYCVDEINYSYASNILNEHRKKSISFLKNSLIK
ncbi:polysaccharide pyruvyl transferase family protein [Enterovibrio sp. Hal110]